MAITIDGDNGVSGVNGSATTPALQGTDSNTGIVFGTDEVQVATGGSTRATVDSSGRLMVGVSSSRSVSSLEGHLQVEGTGGDSSTISVTRNVASAAPPRVCLAKSRGTSVGSSVVVQDDDSLGEISFSGADGTDANSVAATILCKVDGTPGSNDMPGRLMFNTTADGASSSTERLRINSEGKIQVTGTRGGSLQPEDNDSLELFTSATSANANTGCGLTFYNNDGNGYEMGGTIQVAKENGSINNTAGYMRFSTRPNAAGPVERMRIGSGGDVLISRTSASISNVGHYFLSVGAFNHTRSGDTVGEINRLSNDGTLINFRQADSVEGSISVSGSTVSYNGGHLARWSQLASGAERTEILRGSVLSNLDEMCEWAYDAQDAVLYTEEDELPEGVSVGDVKTPAVAAGTEDNEQLNRMKVSDVEGDVNVAGVFQAWDDDDDTYTNDFYCAMTGDFVIRIAQGTTVARGDLLMSAGDGTAKPQDDDIVRSKTIAKVTSTTVSTTYSDGSYCVPCVLMAC